MSKVFSAADDEELFEEELDPNDLEPVEVTGTMPRASVPPPVPEPARRSSRPPQVVGRPRPSIPPPAARGALRPSVPPPPRTPGGEADAMRSETRSVRDTGVFETDSGVLTSAPPSGLWRIQAEQHEPSGETVLELKSVLAQVRAERREQAAYIERLRLAVQLRDDRIAALKRELHAERERVNEMCEELRRREQVATPDDLKRINGIGPAFERALHAAGITTIAEIAAFTAEDIERVAQLLNTTVKRIERDGWVTSAQALLSQA